ncbi:MAG TPA: ATP-binding protein, partial [Candidatus Acidoferrales bacterium]|nr:ATP-binding protein [Candidatus Acidoferrales bacterium]
MSVTSAADRVVLHGRDRELALAEDLLRRVAKAGSAGVIVIKGDAGIGKTALLDALAERAIDASFSVSRSNANESHQIAPLALLLLALRSGPSPVLSRKAFESLAPYRDHPLWLVDRIIGVIEDR